MLSPPISPRGRLPCLSISPALMDASACSWEELTQLLLHASERERRCIEQEEHMVFKNISHDAQYQRRCMVEREEEGEDDAEVSELRDVPRLRAHTPRAVSAQPKSRGTEHSGMSLSLSTSSRLTTPRTPDAAPAPSLTLFQRVCFTKSTAAKYKEACSEQKPRCRAGHTRPSSQRSPALRRPTSRAATYEMGRHVDAAAAGAPVVEAGIGASAAAAPSGRAVWSWSNSRSRDTAAPAAAPTLARTYGSAAQRAVSMELIFDRLSYEGKALVARQAESLGLLRAASAASSPRRAAAADSSSQLSEEPSRDVDATVLDCVSDETQTIANGDSRLLRAAALQSSPGPVSPLAATP